MSSLFLILLFSVGSFAAQPELFLSTSEITYAINRKYEPEPILEKYYQDHFSASLANQSLEARAKVVFEHMVKLKFGPERHEQLKDFIKVGSGNCYAHSRLSLFLLRKLKVPAKPLYELHLEPVDRERRASAKDAKSNLFGLAHNDHLSVLFFDGKVWQPFDSAMRVFGMSEFRKRSPKKVIEIFAEGKGHQIFVGPPFAIWSVTTDGKSINAISELLLGSKPSPLQKEFASLNSPQDFELSYSSKTEKKFAVAAKDLFGKTK